MRREDAIYQPLSKHNRNGFVTIALHRNAFASGDCSQELSLRDYNTQVGETYAMIKALSSLQSLVYMKLNVLLKYQSIWGSHASQLIEKQSHTRAKN